MDKSTPAPTEDQASGWQAIDEALRPLYGEQEPLHWGTLVKYMMGGPDPLDGISAYPREEPAPHWHLVSYGLSELYAQESPNAELSGFGFELTMRLARKAGEEQPPNWVLNFLQNLARYVFDSGNLFSAGHHMHLNGPIALDSETEIQAIAFVADPELPAIDTPHGRLEFLQIVGLTDGEYYSTLRWNTGRVLEVLAEHLPLLLTDIARPSLLETKEVQAQINAGVRAEGSSTGALYTNQASWSRRWSLAGRRTTLVLDVHTAFRVALVLPARIGVGESLLLSSSDTKVFFESAETPEQHTDPDENLHLGLTGEAARALSQDLMRGVGTYAVPQLSKTAIEVVPTVIRDQEGNVVQTLEVPPKIPGM
jgi:hypothetical protein